MRHSPIKKTKSTPARLAPLCFASLPHAARLALLPQAALDCPLLISVRVCLRVTVAWYAGPTRRADGHLQVAVLGYRPCQARCEAAASLPRRVAAAYLPCRAATTEPLPTNIAGPLPPVNSTCRRASILQASMRCLR